MRLTQLIQFCTLAVFIGILHGCSSYTKSDDTNPLSQKKINLLPQFISYFDEHKVILESDSILFQCYKEGTKVYWINDSLSINPEGKKLLELLINANYYGLDSSMYSLYKIREEIATINSNSDLNNRYEKAMILEVLLTQSYIKLGSHLHHGIIEIKSDLTDLELKNDTINMASILHSSYSNKKMIEALIQLQPAHKEYVLLQKSLENFVANNLINDKKIEVPVYKKDSVKSYSLAREALELYGYIDTTVHDSLLLSALKKFQEDNGLTPDGVIGKHTAKYLSRSTLDIWLQAAINLERWKWKKDWGTDYFYANIPEYKLKIYEKNEVKQEHKAVVGTVTKQTPTLDSKLDYFIVNPEWFVPRSITVEELIPKMKKDSTYLDRNGYSIISKEGVKASDINWSSASANNFKYNIKQAKGSGNALGKIKFIFNNKHSVYFHDTPSKSFFNRDIRSYSHGCVRIQNPLDLGAYLLERENKGYTASSIDSIVKTRVVKSITPSHEYPVHISYFSSAGSPDGELRTFLDIYSRDVEVKERLLKAFENQQGGPHNPL